MNGKQNIIYGTARLGIDDYGYPKQSSKIKKVPLLEKICDLGISTFDTSPRYKNAELTLGKFIKTSKKNIIVNTKIDLLKPSSYRSIEMIYSSVANSIDRLFVDRIDTIYLHQNDLEIISDLHIHDGLRNLIEKGMVKNIGVSVYYPEEISFALKNDLFNTIQLPCNILDKSLFDIYIKSNKQKKIHFRSILLQGIISDNSDKSGIIPDHDSFIQDISIMQNLANNEGISLNELAYAYVSSLKGNNKFIVGSTNISHIQSTINDLDKTISQNTIKKIDLIASQKKKYTNPKLWNS